KALPLLPGGQVVAGSSPVSRTSFHSHGPRLAREIAWTGDEAGQGIQLRVNRFVLAAITIRTRITKIISVRFRSSPVPRNMDGSTLLIRKDVLHEFSQLVFSPSGACVRFLTRFVNRASGKPHFLR